MFQLNAENKMIYVINVFAITFNLPRKTKTKRIELKKTHKRFYKDLRTTQKESYMILIATNGGLKKLVDGISRTEGTLLSVNDEAGLQ